MEISVEYELVNLFQEMLIAPTPTHNFHININSEYSIKCSLFFVCAEPLVMPCLTLLSAAIRHFMLWKQKLFSF